MSQMQPLVDQRLDLELAFGGIGFGLLELGKQVGELRVKTPTETAYIDGMCDSIVVG